MLCVLPAKRVLETSVVEMVALALRLKTILLYALGGKRLIAPSPYPYRKDANLEIMLCVHPVKCVLETSVVEMVALARRHKTILLYALAGKRLIVPSPYP